MSETSPKYRTGDSGDEQPEDWGGTLLPVPGLTDTELEATAEHVRMARAGSESAAQLIINHDVPMLLVEVRRLQRENEGLRESRMAWRHQAWQAGVPYTPEGKVR